MKYFSSMNRRQYYRCLNSGIIIGVGCLFILLVMLVQPFSSINSFLTDRLFAEEPPSPNIVIVGIDDATLKTYGKWSEWSRGLHAEAIQNLSSAGALAIGFDVLFADTSADDPALAAAIEGAGNVVLAAVGADTFKAGGSILEYEKFILPVLSLKEASYGIGHANVTPDGDGVVRQLPLIAADSGGLTLPSLSAALLYAAFAQPLPQTYSTNRGKLNLLDREIPVDGYQRIRINYTSVNTSYSYLSYGDIIGGDFDPAIVKNKIVIVGMTATGELDTWATPVAATKQPGVWIHANVMDSILRGRFLTDAPWAVTVVIMLLLTAITAILLPRLKLKWGAVLIIAFILGYAVVCFVMFDRGYILNLLYPSMLLPLVYVASVICVVVCEQSHKQLIKDLFGRYVSPQVAAELLNLNDNGKLQLGGQRKTVTILFADIRGFTKMSEQMTPEEVVSMLNTYLTVMIERVIANDGIVNKFAGDNIMGVWNAPQSQQLHALLAVRAALESQQAIQKKQQEDATLPRVQFGIGINTGDAVAGNMGSVGRAEYTVIGDAVNLASRICSVAPGGEVWIGPETYKQAGDAIVAEPLPPQSFKGKAEPVTVYKVLSVK